MIEAHIVKALREHLNESQTVFGMRFGVGQTTVHKWETQGVKSSLAERAVQAVIDEQPKGVRRSGKALAGSTPVTSTT